MHLILGEARDKGAAAVKLYAEGYPRSRLAKQRTFQTIDRHIKETGTIRSSTVDRRRRRSA
jgi:hypothetical protein